MYGKSLVRLEEDENINLFSGSKNRFKLQLAAGRPKYNPDPMLRFHYQLQTTPANHTKGSRDFPHSQHGPTIIESGVQIPLDTPTPRHRWTFKWADKFSHDIDKCLGWIKPVSRNLTQESFIKNTFPAGPKIAMRCTKTFWKAALKI